MGVGEFNIICKSNGNTATLLMIDTAELISAPGRFTWGVVNYSAKGKAASFTRRAADEAASEELARVTSL